MSTDKLMAEPEARAEAAERRIAEAVAAERARIIRLAEQMEETNSSTEPVTAIQLANLLRARATPAGQESADVKG